MAFWTFRKQKKEVADMATRDEREIEKAREDIERKGKDSQTERDREDESVAAQERARGEEDSQTAKDRIDESRGARREDEERGRERKEEKEDDRRDERRDDFRERIDKLEEKLDRVLEAFEKRGDESGGAMERAKETYGVGNRAFGETAGEGRDGNVTEKDILDVLRRIKG